MFGESFVVAGQTPGPHQPGVGRLDDPPPVESLETRGVVAALDDFHQNPEVVPGDGEQFAGVAAVGPDQHDDQQSQGVGDDMPLAYRSVCKRAAKDGHLRDEVPMAVCVERRHARDFYDQLFVDRVSGDFRPDEWLVSDKHY